MKIILYESPLKNCPVSIRCHKLLIIAKNTTAINKLHYTRSSYKIYGFVIVEAGGKIRKLRMIKSHKVMEAFHSAWFFI
jgi:hypothetical protein